MRQHQVTVAATFTFTVNGLSEEEMYESTKAQLMNQGFDVTDITEVGK